MKNIFLVLALLWAGLNTIGTVMPIPEELKFPDTLANWKRWSALGGAVMLAAIFRFHEKLTWRQIQRRLKVGISWNTNVWTLGFTGSSDTPIIGVHCVQFAGRNNRRFPLTEVKAYLIYPKHPNNLQVTCTVTLMNHAPNPVTEIPSEKHFLVIGNTPLHTASEFLANCTPFAFVLHSAQGEWTRIYSHGDIKKMIKRYERDVEATRRKLEEI